jgi:PAS domain S-box-containing protein
VTVGRAGIRAGPQGLTIKRLLLALVGAGVVYVGGIVLVIAVRIAPTASALQQHSTSVLASHDAARIRIATLGKTIGPVHALIVRSSAAPPSPSAIDQLVARIRGMLDRSAALLYAQSVQGAPAQMRMDLASAAQAESDLGFALLDALAELRLGHTRASIAGLRAADAHRQRAEAFLQSAQRAALTDMTVRERQLGDAAAFAGRAVFWWLLIGSALLPLLAWFVHRRLHAPLSQLERALSRITSGDLEVQVAVARDDEIGRLTRHLNDMTAVLRLRTEDERRRRENLNERLGHLLQESDNQILVLAGDTLVVAQASRGAVEYLGYTPLEFQSLRFEDLLPTADAARLARLLEDLRTGRRSGVSLETRLSRKDGRSYPATINVQLSRAERPAVFLVVAQDISERREAERLREALRHFSLSSATLDAEDLDRAIHRITEATAKGLRAERASVWRVDGTRLICADQYERTGARHGIAPEATLAGCPSYVQALGAERVTAVADTRTDPRTQGLVAMGVGATLEAAIRRTGKLTGVLRVEHVGRSRQWTPDEQSFIASMADFVVIAHEGAERRNLQTQLAKAQRLEAVGKLAGGIAHDFNNLLSAITMFAELISADLAAEDPHRQDLEQVQQAVKRGSLLTRQLLAFSRQQVLQPTVLDPNVVITDVAKMLKRLIGEDIELVMRLDPGAGCVRADAGQLEQVLLNLVVNARDAMPSGGSVTIATAATRLDHDAARQLGLAQSGRFVTIAVADTGAGMTAEVRARVFEPFFSTKGAKGTGLGLATSYGIVTQSGGHIGVASEPGRGCTFTIYLPAVPEAPSEAATTEHASRPRPGCETILLAEDDPAVRAAGVAALTRCGYSVIAARNGDEALEKAARHAGPIHLVVSDVVMPGIDGRELIERVRPVYPHAKGLLTSGYAGDAIARRGVLGSGLPLLEKPFTAATLTRKVREVLDSGT